MQYLSIIKKRNLRDRPLRGTVLRAALMDFAGNRALLVATLPLLLGAAALLIAPGRVYSAEMTWDLLCNLDGAWRIHLGQMPHVDFHTELGMLPFVLTELAMRLLGPRVLTVPAGEILFSCLILGLCIVAVRDRLPFLAGIVCVVFCTFIVLMPMTYGDHFWSYSFAMIYNRYGWSLSLILYVVLFIPPKRTSWSDYCLVFTLLMLLFYIKITYFAVGMAALGVAIVLPGSIASNRRRWIAVFLILALFPVAPFNRPYLTDIVTAALAGGVRTRVWGLADSFLADPTEYAFAISGCVLLAVLASLPQLQVSWANPMFGLFIVTSSAALLSQNAQTQGIPTYQVIALLLYRLLRDLLTAGRLAPAGQLSSLLLAPLVFPVVAILASGLGLAHYSYTLFVKSDHLVAAQVGNLRGLAVQQDQFSRFADASADPLNRTRLFGLRHELSQSEYLETLQDLGSLWVSGEMPGAEPHILMLDRVSAMPFVLALPAPKGKDIWWGDEWNDGLIARPDEEVFADVDYVAVPRYSSKRRTTCDLLIRYGDYLGQHFSTWRVTPEWLVLRRGIPLDRVDESRALNQYIRSCLNYPASHLGR